MAIAQVLKAAHGVDDTVKVGFEARWEGNKEDHEKNGDGHR